MTTMTKLVEWSFDPIGVSWLPLNRLAVLCIVVLFIAQYVCEADVLHLTWLDASRTPRICWLELTLHPIHSSRCMIDKWTLTHLELGMWAWLVVLLWTRHPSFMFAHPHRHGSRETRQDVMETRTLLYSVRFVMAAAVGSAWECIENTNFIVSRFRKTAQDKQYQGDSILNSLTDTALNVCGTWLASFGAAVLVQYTHPRHGHWHGRPHHEYEWMLCHQCTHRYMIQITLSLILVNELFCYFVLDSSFLLAGLSLWYPDIMS